MLNKLCYTFTIDFYLAIIRDESLMHAKLRWTFQNGDELQGNDDELKQNKKPISKD